jgi:hypothetical protein
MLYLILPLLSYGKIRGNFQCQTGKEKLNLGRLCDVKIKEKYQVK